MAINKRKILEAAQKFLAKGALDKALKEYQTLLQADPRDSGSRLKLGDIQLKLGHKDEAVAQYTKVAEQFMKDGFDAKAVALYKQILKIDPQRADVHVPLSELYQRLGLTSEAMAALQTAADAYHREGKKREALDLLRKMAQLDPSNTTSRMKIAELLRAAGLPDEAIAEYEEVAQELLRHGEREALVGVYERILELEPTRVGTMLALARQLLEGAEPARAEPWARRAVEARPDALEGYDLLAEVLRAAGRDGELEPVYRKLAELHRERGDEARAREIQQRFLTAEPLQLGADDSGLSFGNTDVSGSAPEPSADDDVAVLDDTPAPRLEAGGSLDAGDLDLTGDVSDDAFFAATTDPGAQATVAVPQAVPAAPPGAATPAADVDVEQLVAEASVYLRYAKVDRAIECLEQVLAAEPEHRGALEKLGDAHAARGDAERAVPYLVQAAKLAQAEGDAAAFGALRQRLESVSPAEAAKLAAAAPAEPRGPGAPAAARGAAAETVFMAVTGPGAAPGAAARTVVAFGAEGSAAAGSEDPADGELEIDLDPSLLGDDLAPALDTDDAAGAEAGAPDSDLGLDLEVQRPAQPDAVVVPGPAAAHAAGAGSSSSTPGQILEDLEEAEFYFHQGLHDEAESVYQRILQTAPNHPQALLRLGEIAASRGQDPGTSASGMAPLAATPASVDPSGEPARAEARVDVAPEPDLGDAPLPDLPGLGDETGGQDDATAAPPQAHAADEPGAPGDVDLGADLDDAPGDDLETGGGEIDPSALGGGDADEVSLELGMEGDDTPPAAPPSVEDGSMTGRWLRTQPGLEPNLLDDDSTEPGDALAAGDEPSAPGVAPGDLDLGDEAGAPGGPAQASAAGDDDDTTASEPGLGLEDIAAELLADAEAAGHEEAADRDLAAPHDDAHAEATSAAGSEDEPLPDEDDTGVVTPAPGLHAGADTEEGHGTGGGDADFDLAAELSDALAGDETRAGAPSAGGGVDDGFEAVFREFKRGVQRTVGEGDYETHYDLGIAYREMGLLDDAVEEFRLAIGSPTRRLDCLHMLGLCALEAKRPQDAAAHLEQALALEGVPDAQLAALRFDLGRAYQEQGDARRALAAFQAVAEHDGGFQDVAERIRQLEQGAIEAGSLDVASEAAPADDASSEVFESFDDLLAEAHAEAAAAAPAPSAANAAAAPEPAPAPHRDETAEEAARDDRSPRAATTGAETPAPPASPAPAQDAAEAPAASQPAPADDAKKGGAPRRRKISFL